jgi:UDP-glucose 4-epimerase
MDKDKILITGGAGFIGSHLVDHHIAKGDKVWVVDSLSTGSRRNIAHHGDNPQFTFYESRLQSWPELPDIVARADRIYHLAAVVGVKHVLEDPLEVLDTNVGSTNTLLQAVKDKNPKARVIIASSSEVYGLNPNPPFKEMDDLVLPSRDPVRWCYAVTKLTDEMLAFSYAHKHGINVTAVRFFNTVGPRQSGRYGMVVANFVEHALKNQDIVVYGDGKQTRSFGDVRDVATAIDLLARSDEAKGTVVNVGTDQEISINDLARLVIEVTGSTAGLSHITYKEAYGAEFIDVKRRRPDLSLLTKLTGHKPKWKLSETIRSMMEISRATAA